MKKAFIVSISFILITFVSISMGSAAGGQNQGKGGKAQTEQGEAGTVSSLGDKEIDHIRYIREEEKLARDVYLTLTELYQASIFGSIAESEQRHMDAVQGLIEKYGLEDPVEDDAVGKFSNPVFTALYEELVEKGETGYCEALQVGVAIEELDIEDIEIALNDVEARDVSRVFNNLLNGSYNHLNAFNSQYEAAGCQ